MIRPASLAPGNKFRVSGKVGEQCSIATFEEKIQNSGGSRKMI
jgi:hypothetical protein